jgi:hypothetical protein
MGNYVIVVGNYVTAAEISPPYDSGVGEAELVRRRIAGNGIVPY